LLKHQTLLAIRQLRGIYISENQAEIIIEIIIEYNLRSRIRYFITDNTTNNDTAIEAVLKHFFLK
jgi:hypothetical protein